MIVNGYIWISTYLYLILNEIICIDDKLVYGSWVSLHVKEDKPVPIFSAFKKKKKNCEQYIDISPVLYAGTMGTWSYSEWDVFSPVDNQAKAGKQM